MFQKKKNFIEMKKAKNSPLNSSSDMI